MSAPADVPIKLEHRPVFGFLPYQLPEDNTSAHQSFPFLPGYRHISFEERRLEDMESPPPPMATGKFGMFTASALRCLKTAFNGRKEFTSRDVDLVEPLLPLATIRVPWKDHNPAVFGIHKNILEHCSLFFKVLFARDVESPGSPIVQCEHAMTRVTELEASVVAFRIYAEWVYSGLIRTKDLKLDGREGDETAFHNIGQAYILGERLQDYGFRMQSSTSLWRRSSYNARLILLCPRSSSTRLL